MTTLNIVTCGHCGGIFAHQTPLTQAENMTCPYCRMTDDISSFPDLHLDDTNTIKV